MLCPLSLRERFERLGIQGLLLLLMMAASATGVPSARGVRSRAQPRALVCACVRFSVPIRQFCFTLCASEEFFLDGSDLAYLFGSWIESRHARVSALRLKGPHRVQHKLFASLSHFQRSTEQTVSGSGIHVVVYHNFACMEVSVDFYEHGVNLRYRRPGCRWSCLRNE